METYMCASLFPNNVEKSQINQVPVSPESCALLPGTLRILEGYYESTIDIVRMRAH